MDGKLSTHYTRWAYDEKGLKKNEREKIEFNFSEFFFNRACLTREGGHCVVQRKQNVINSWLGKKFSFFISLLCFCSSIYIIK